MKKRVFLIMISFVLIITLIGCAPTKKDDDEDPVIPIAHKADFEIDLDGWVPASYYASALRVANAGRNNSYGMHMSGRFGNWHGVMRRADFLKAGETYSFSGWVFQETGKEQTIQFEFKVFSGSFPRNKKAVIAPSGQWVELKWEGIVPENVSSKKELHITMTSNETADFFMDDVEIMGNVNEDYFDTESMSQFYDDMIQASLVSTGNNYRLKNVIEKAKSGDDITLAYIGGSITEGSISTVFRYSWSYLSYKHFADNFGKGNNVHIVNAGQSGTPSSWGIVRYRSDVLDRIPAEDEDGLPDVVFIEFAVNDYDDETGGAAYEGLVRNILKAPNSPAVVLVMSVFRDMGTKQDLYIPIGAAYGLPTISIKNAIKPKLDGKILSLDQFFADIYHPNDAGHKIMADCLNNLFDTINKEEKAAMDVSFPAKPVISDRFEGLIQIDNSLTDEDFTALGITFNKGTFTGVDIHTGILQEDNRDKAPQNFMNVPVNGLSQAMEIKVKAKNFMFVYKANGTNTINFGLVEIYVDNVKQNVNISHGGGWNQAIEIELFNNKTATEHTIKIVMTDSDKNKPFTILSMGYTP